MASIVQAVTGGNSGNSGGAGVNYQASQAPLLQSATTANANTTFQQQQQTLQQQQAFAAAVAAANGIGNQTNVFEQLQGIANGTGPNPAQAQLAQSTAANVAQTASQMAGQRGSGANVGLAARQIGQQGAATQQNAANQAATLQANQSLNAINSAGNIATNQVNQQANATQGAGQLALSGQGNTLGAIAAQNQATVGSTSSANSANAGVSGQVAAGQQQLLGNLLGGAGSALNLAEGGKVPQKMADAGVVQPAATQLQPIQSSSSAPTSSGPTSRIGQYFAQQSSPNGSQLTGMSAAGNTIGKGIGTGLKALYGAAKSTSGGSDTSNDQASWNDQMMNINRPDLTEGTQAPAVQDTPALTNAAGDLEQLAAAGGVMEQVKQLAPFVSALMASGGKVPVLLSPGEKKLTPQQAKAAAGGQIDPIKAGKTVPGKPKVKGAKNSYANDVVKDAVEPGTLILPRSVTQAKHPAWEAHKFVMQHMAMAKGGKVK